MEDIGLIEKRKGGVVLSEAIILVHKDIRSCMIVLPIFDAIASISTLIGLATRDRRVRIKIRRRRGRKTAELNQTCNPNQY